MDRRDAFRSGIVVLLLSGALAPSALPAQGNLGKLIGRVTDPGGAAIVQAQVSLVGTAFGALTDPRGYFFINNIPPGRYDARAVFIGFASTEARGLRILSGQTLTQDFTLEPRAIELEEITVIAGADPLAPRDQVTTRQRLDGAFTAKLPVDRYEKALTLQPGIAPGSQRGEQSIVIRGGRTDEAAVYIDGIPASPGDRGTNDLFTSRNALKVGTSGLEEAVVTTGAISAELGNAQSGVISLSTRSGGDRWSGSLGMESDEMFGAQHSPGTNIIRAALGGPLWGRLTVFGSADLEGLRSPDEGPGSEKYPIFVSAGVDTAVAVPDLTTSPADTTMVNIYKFAVYRGECEQFEGSRNPGIARNYGVECQGIRYPAAAQGNARLMGKLAYGYGTGSRISFTAVGSQQQIRQFIQANTFESQYQRLYTPENLSATQYRNRALNLNWTHNFSQTSGRALALDAALSHQRDDAVSGPLTVAGAEDSRDPWGGLLLKPLDFRWDLDNFAVTDEMIRAIRQDDPNVPVTPYPSNSFDQRRLIDEYRNNAYGLLGFSESGGPVGPMFLQREDRWVGRVVVDWQANRYHRVRAGGDATLYDIMWYQTDNGLDGYFGNAANAIHEQPIRGALYLEDRIDLGDLVLSGGLRFDAYNSRAKRPRRIPADSSITPAEYFARSTERVADQAHSYLSPHVQVAFPVSDRTSVRFSYAHQVQAPSLTLVLDEINLHPATPSWTSDLDFARSIIFEVGARYNVSDDLVLDLAAYNKIKSGDPALRQQSYFDGREQAAAGFYVMTNADFGTVRGLDLRMDYRLGQWMNGMLGYSFTWAENTGTDPFSLFNFTSNTLASLTGQLAQPAEAAHVTGDSRPHSLGGAVLVTVPQGWKAGTFSGKLLQGMAASAVFRYASGTPYTSCTNSPDASRHLSGDGPCPGRDPKLADYNGARLPPIKQFDLRVSRDFGLGRGLGASVYLDVRNLFNLENVVRVFSGTGTTSNPLDKKDWWSGDSAGYANEALASGVYDTATGTVNLQFGGAGRGGCANWVTQGAAPSAPNCVYLVQAEERWGNGDHLFSLEEQRRASMAFYNTGVRGGLAPPRFMLPPRRFHLGVQINF